MCFFVFVIRVQFLRYHHISFKDKKPRFPMPKSVGTHFITEDLIRKTPSVLETL